MFSPLFQPYCGVTGIKEPEQARMILGNAPKIPGRKIGIGVVATPESIRGQRIEGRCAKPEKIKEIFQNDPRAFNILHVWDPAKNHELMYENVMLACDVAGEYCKAVQFNFPWPHPQAIAHLAIRVPRIGLILHIGKRALLAVESRPEACARKIIDDYGHVIDYVIFDQSDGRGDPLDPDFLYPFLEETRFKNERFGLVVAGGISSQNLDGVRSLVEAFPDISTDAETGVHDPADAFSPERAIELLSKEAELFQAM